MTTTRTLAMAIAGAVLVWTVAPTLADSPADRGDGISQSQGPLQGSLKGDKEKDKGVKGDKKKAGRTSIHSKKTNKVKVKRLKHKGNPESDENEHSNKGGELRGLNRADQVAGEHGKQGRDNARDTHGKHLR